MDTNRNTPAHSSSATPYQAKLCCLNQLTSAELYTLSTSTELVVIYTMSKSESEAKILNTEDDDEPDDWSVLGSGLNGQDLHRDRDKRIFSTGCAGE